MAFGCNDERGRRPRREQSFGPAAFTHRKTSEQQPQAFSGMRFPYAGRKIDSLVSLQVKSGTVSACVVMSTKAKPQPLFLIVQAILDEDKKFELTARDIALLILMHNEMQTSDDMLLALPHSTIQILVNRIDSIDIKPMEKSERRVTESLSRLLKAEALIKTDLVQLRLKGEAEYQITTIGESIADWYTTQLIFSGEPLTTIFRAFNNQLLKISEHAQEARDDADWELDVISPTKYVLREMLGNVQKHQRELDRQHQIIRNFVPTLLTENTEESIALCETQLDEVIKTIEDLQEVVLSAASSAFSIINKIETLAREHKNRRVMSLYDELSRQLNAITEWTTPRAIDWFNHHNLVHGYLRTVIRVDRDRRITAALKLAVSEIPTWTMMIADEDAFAKIREDLFLTKVAKRAPRVLKESQQRIREFSTSEPSHVREFLLDLLRKELETFDEANASKLFQVANDEYKNITFLITHYPWLMEVMDMEGQRDSFRQWQRLTDAVTLEEFRVRRN